MPLICRKTKAFFYIASNIFSKPSKKWNPRYFSKTSSKEIDHSTIAKSSRNWTRNISLQPALKRKKKDHCILITKYASHYSYAWKLKLFFKLLRIFFRNPLKKWNSKYFSQSSSEEMSTDSDNSNLYSSYAAKINRSFFSFLHDHRWYSLFSRYIHQF